MRLRAPRRDVGEAAIVQVLRAVGAIVVQLDIRDIPDLLVGFAGVWRLIEVKQPIGPRGGERGPDGRHLSEGQHEFFIVALQKNLPVHVARTPEEALAIVGIRTKGGP